MTTEEKNPKKKGKTSVSMLWPSAAVAIRASEELFPEQVDGILRSSWPISPE